MLQQQIKSSLLSYYHSPTKAVVTGYIDAGCQVRMNQTKKFDNLILE